MHAILVTAVEFHVRQLLFYVLMHVLLCVVEQAHIPLAAALVHDA